MKVILSDAVARVEWEEVEMRISLCYDRLFSMLVTNHRFEAVFVIIPEQWLRHLRLSERTPLMKVGCHISIKRF